MLANIGVIVAQLFALEASDTGFGYSSIGKPMAAVCFATAIMIIIQGALRAWRYQRALIRGKALSGGFELMTISTLTLTVCGTVLAIISQSWIVRPETDIIIRRSFASSSAF